MDDGYELEFLEEGDEGPDRPDPRSWAYDADGYDEHGWRRGLQPSESRYLRPYVTGHDADLGDADALRRTLETAEDERPLQRFLEDRPHLLATSFLIGGHGRYVRSQVRLGSEYVPDFVLGDASSMGLFWTLVELESPREPMFLASGEWAVKARHAIHQIQSWRRWLGENLDYARKQPPAGIGLIDVEASPEAVILIGRRSAGTPDANWLRKETLRDLRIRVQTYDELLDRVAGSERTARRFADRDTSGE